MSKEKTKYEKHSLLNLLEKTPTYESDVKAYEEWVDEVKTEVNVLLGLFEDDEKVEVALKEIKDDIANLRNTLERHKHLKDGTAVEKI